jgi:hypothetical protein
METPDPERISYHGRNDPLGGGMNLKRLPLEGGLLEELRIFGNGKRCSVRMETTEPEGKVRFRMMDPVIEIDLRGRARAIVFNDRSDVELGFRILPVEPLRVENFVVDYADTDSEWRKVLRNIREGQPGPLEFDAESVRRTLVPERTPGSPAVPEP